MRKSNPLAAVRGCGLPTKPHLKDRDRITEQDGSVKFHRIRNVEFWLSPSNRLFLMVPGPIGRRPVFPTVIGSALRFDSQFVAELDVAEKVRSLLKKQLDIRRNWPAPEEDEEAFRYS